VVRDGVPDQHLFDPPPVLSERQYQSQIQQLLTREGWRWQHVYRMKDPHGRWRTSTTATGWPDLVCLRGEWILAIEVKAAKGKPTDIQLGWLAAFAAIPNGLAWLLSPKDNRQQISNWIHAPGIADRRYGW
jgi:hypothetical protein